MSITKRRYDIDWLRVITIGLLLIYHIAIVFQPWGVFIGFIQSDESLVSLWIPMSMLNIWRIPLLFFVSGMGVCFAIRKRNWKQLLLERTKRIFLPFVFGVFFIVPIHMMIWQKYYTQDVVYNPSEGHLWFLLNIFIYVIVLSPVFYYLIKNENGKINNWFKKIYKTPLGLLFISIPFILEGILVNPEAYEMYALTLHGYVLGVLAFFFGFNFVLNGKTLWPTLLKWRWLFLAIALTFFFVRFFAFDLKTPNYIMPIESCVWIFAVFGFAYKHLNRPSKALSYLSQGAYPIYILHMVFLYLGSYIILPLELPVFIKFILIIAFTGIGCFASYDLVILRINFLRPLFGLKQKKKVQKETKIAVSKPSIPN